ncbi:MAG: hypothetical protein AB1714_25785 [Acidobacteriota bacterium]
MGATASHQISLRVPEPLYQEVKRVARSRRVSMNHLAQEGLRKMTQEDTACRMREAYDALGRDSDESNVKRFLPAQSEVVRRD